MTEKNKPVTPEAKTTITPPKPFGSKGPAAAGDFFPSAVQAFPDLTASMEARLTFAYQDTRNLVTTGAGALIDPVALAVKLPWQVDGQPIDDGEKARQWQLVKGNTNKSRMSVNAVRIPGNTMRLSFAEVDKLTQIRLHADIQFVTKANQFPRTLTWCADAQLALLFVMWGTGAGLRIVKAFFPAFIDAMDAQPEDFLKMAGTATWSNVNPDRRGWIKFLFTNAAFVVKQQGDKSALNWPVALSDTVLAVGAPGAPAAQPPPP